MLGLSPRLRTLTITLALVAIVALAAWLRVTHLPPVLVSGDDAITPAFVADAWPEAGAGPRSLASTSYHAAGNPLRIFAFLYGWLLPACCFLAAALWTALGLPVTELTWAAPQLLAGSITPIPAYFLVRRLAGPGWGLLAALGIAVVPIHVLFSRGLCPGVVLAFLCQLLAILAFLRYAERPGAGRAWVAGGAFFLAMNAQVEWMGLVPVLAAAAWLASPAQGSAGLRARSALALLRRPAFLALPALGLAALIAGGIAVGGPLRHLLHKGGGGEPGFYLGFWLWVLAQNFGIVLAALAALGAAASAWRLRGPALIPFAWAAAYALPYFVWVKPDATIVETYLPHGQQALLLGLPVALATLPWPGLRRAGVHAFLAGCILAGGSAAVTAWDLPGPEAFRKQGYIYRRHVPDPGYKAAGWWIRERLAPEARAHVLAFGGGGFEPLVAAYYTGRLTGGLTDASESKAVEDLRGSLAKTEVIVVAEADLPALKGGLAFALASDFAPAAIVLRGGEPVIRIFQRGRTAPPDRVRVEEANPAFDRRYGRMGLLAGPDKVRKAAKAPDAGWD